MSFTESNTVEQMILATLAPRRSAEPFALREAPPGWGGSLGGELRPPKWEYVPATEVPRQPGDVMVEAWLRLALIRLNPEIAAQPDRADEVIYALRAILLSVQADGLVRANENFMAWLRGEKTMPFGPHGEHVPVRLVDAANPAHTQLVVTNQWIYQSGAVEKRFDVMFVVNGLPIVIGEAKTPTRSAVTWFDGAFQINEIYERQVPAMFVPNVFSFATEGKLLRYGTIRMPIDIWGPWRTRENEPEGSLADVRRTVESMLRPEVVLDILQSFTVFATDKKHRRIKIICRYQQYFTTNQIVERVVKGYPKKGLIWHFQGSGKTLLMVFAAQKLRLHPQLGNPTVIIVVDRIDLDTQITATFNAADVPNMVGVATRQELQDLLGQELRKALPLQVQKCLAFFPGVDRTVGGYEGLMAAQQCLPNNDVRDKFAAQYSVLGTIWEALSPDPCLSPYETDYRWLTQVYESVKPPSGNGKLLWHALGAKTIELINRNVHLESVHDDLETLV
ncbi:MAG: type I restriction endonuclease, partial [Verrucomicrobia bacterium]|nr:type I restriction endonuclease [Verrucomicrobiota bacterium]